jgi:hypothetical protein
MYHLRRYLERVEKLVAAYTSLTGDELSTDQIADELDRLAPGRGARLAIGQDRSSAVGVAAGPARGS